MIRTQAIVFESIDNAAVRLLDMPEPDSGEVQIRTLYSTISSGTEGWLLSNRFTWTPTRYPCVPGYQRVGIIEAIGPDVVGWNVGDRVVATRSNWSNAVYPQAGSHIALANSPIAEVYAVPEAVDSVDASCAVVVQVGYNAASRVAMQPGDWIVVYGDGLIGQLAAQAARARGARVILVGHRPKRLSLAARYAADSVIDNYRDDVVERVHEYTDGSPVTAVLDSVQTVEAQTEYMRLLARGGKYQIVYCGFTPGTAWADMGLLQQRELTTHYISGWTRERMDATLDLMAAGRLSLRPLVTHQVPYTQGPEMYRLNAEKSPAVLGITLDWTDAGV